MSVSRSLAIVGSGGAGVVVTGEMCLHAVAYAGGFGHLRKSFGPQIRGGESAAILTLSNQPLENIGSVCDCLVVIDWKNFDRFQDEIKLESTTLIIADEKAGQPPGSLGALRETIISLPFSSIAAAHDSEKTNSVFLGFIGCILALQRSDLEQALHQRFSGKSRELTDIAVRNLQAGYQFLSDNSHAMLQAIKQRCLSLDLTDSCSAEERNSWMLSGNQGLAYGALKAGVRFVAAYPITPASDLLEWLAQHIEAVDGHLVQAEDELSAINMVIGASYGGVPAITATSGPGLSLMAEALGLAVTSEIPLVVFNVMRGGPSTGLPTKSEQADLNLALYGMHGDAPHIVLAPGSIADTVQTGGWAVALAEALQTVVIVLSDQRIGQSIEVLAPPGECTHGAVRQTPHELNEADYLRYLDTESGVSAMSVPGLQNGTYTADGLEHNERGTPSTRSVDHWQQLEKRQRKLTSYDFGALACELYQPDTSTTASPAGNCLLICWGSLSASCRQTAQRLTSDGIETRVLCLRLLSPLPISDIQTQLEWSGMTIVVEQNHQAQLCHYLRSEVAGGLFHSVARPGPIALDTDEIYRSIKPYVSGQELLNHEH